MEEICDNGIDDDGDGLIDCFDSDCFDKPACEDFYYGGSASDCTFEPESTPVFDLELVCQTDHTRYPIDQRSAVYIGDMDGDGIPEMVANDPEPGRIQIFNGIDCSIKQSIVIESNHPFAQVVIADVDRNGLGDIFIFESGNNLARFEYGTATAIWRTSDGIEVNNYSTLHIADFNADGTPEVYAGNQIYNSINGTRLAKGTGSRGSYNANSDSKVIAYDIFQAGDAKPGGGIFGAEADGLELIAGNNVYTVELGNGTMDNGSLNVVSSITSNSLTDGFTSIADIDGDGEIDIVVMDAGKIYVWNPRTQTQIGTSYRIDNNTTGGGRINIGDFDGDGMVEMGTAGFSIYVVVEYDPVQNRLVEKWSKTGVDDGSQRTGSSLFDFEGDGTKELIYSEELHLYILNAATGAEIAKVDAKAGTRTEYPLVADVNADGNAEIIVTAQNVKGPGASGNDFVRVYRSKNIPWVSARPVWNQHGYFNTNINDDLTVPIVQQDVLHNDLGNTFNSFLAQSTILGGGGTPAFAAADAVIEVIEVGTANCPEVLDIAIKVENMGDAQIPAGTPIAFYDANPTLVAANLLGTTVTPTTIEVDSMDTFTHGLNISPLLTPIDIYVVVNDTGFVMANLPYNLATDFPVTGVAECDFENNLDAVSTIICVEICGDEKDNDGDGLADEPTIKASEVSGCSGYALAQMTTDLAGGTWGMISSIGSTIDNNGNVTLGTNNSPVPDVDTVLYLLPPCNDTLLVTTVDNIPPSLSCPGNKNLAVDMDCDIMLGDYTGMATSSDNCTTDNELTLTQTPTAGSTVTIGTTTVTIEATDLSGNKSTCNFQVIVADEIKPSITCPADKELPLDNECELTIEDYTDETTVTDNCTLTSLITQTQMPSAGGVIRGDGLIQTIEITATDEAGNEATCSFNITLDDTLPPDISCPTDQTIAVNANCIINLPDYRSDISHSDNCSSQGQITVEQVPVAGSILTNHGTTQIVTITATDENENEAECSFEVLLEDGIPPSLACPMPVDIVVDENCEAMITDYTGDATVTDNCSTSSITLSQNPMAGTTLEAVNMSHPITITADDGHGNTSMCTFNITLLDTISPSIECMVTDTLILNNLCQVVIPDYTMMTTISDNCSEENAITLMQNPSAGVTISGHGKSQLIVITASDERGNSSVCTTSVYLKDTLPPSLICPMDQVVSVDPMCQYILPDYTSITSIDDNCTEDASISLTQTPAAATVLMGDGTIETITIEGTDNNGNKSECQFTIELSNEIDPSITCPSNRDIEVDNNCEAVIPDYSAQIIVISNCIPMTDFMTIQDPESGTVLTTLGQPETITLMVDNGEGKSASCSFDITLIDTISPVISCPADISVMTDIDCEIILLDYRGMVTGQDNCSTAGNISIDQQPAPATILTGTMTHEIVMTATDESNNTAQCVFQLTTEDGVAPTITCPPNDTLMMEVACDFELADYTTDASVSDQCTDPIDIMVTQSPAPGTLLEGPTSEVVTLTAFDGTDSNDCTFTVSILDTLPPTIDCPINQDVAFNQFCFAVVPDYTASEVVDNCSPSNTLTLTQSPAAGTILALVSPLRTITLTATDNEGNQNSCDFVIQLIDDSPPTISCPADQEVTIMGCEYILPDYTMDIIYSDNCSDNSNIIITQSPAPNTLIEEQSTMIVQEIRIVVIDESGNQTTCSFFIDLDFAFPAVPSLLGN